VEFEWDPEKDAENIAKHGISFQMATTIFGRDRVERPSDRDDEERWCTTGKLADGKLWTVVYTKRGDHVRIISARRAARRERREYRSIFPGGDS
jgi:hypothetical protein